jgi:predicted O-linked N-acetylglucosamine transferase (SPINDLY family)
LVPALVNLGSVRESQGRHGEVAPFPYGGGTTTCDALWMSVPVGTLAGERAVSRLGVSILSNAGFSDLIAETEDDYVNTAVRLSRDLLRLGEMRQGMRDRLKASALMDGAATARGLEDAYRGMWQKWCMA